MCDSQVGEVLGPHLQPSLAFRAMNSTLRPSEFSTLRLGNASVLHCWDSCILSTRHLFHVIFELHLVCCIVERSSPKKRSRSATRRLRTGFSARNATRSRAGCFGARRQFVGRSVTSSMTASSRLTKIRFKVLYGGKGGGR
jgi:hypothetical protein